MITNIIRKALTQKRRGVSPIIAVIMLIGLPVAAGSIVYFTVLPMFEVHPKLEVVYSSSSLSYLENSTEIKASIVLLNIGKGTAEVRGITVEYQSTNGWQIIHDIEILDDLPFDIHPTDQMVVTLYFQPPIEENPIHYRFTVSYQEGAIIISELHLAP